jgi:thioredoxin 2
MATNLVCPHCFAVNRVPEERLGDDPKCGKCHRQVLDSKPAALASATFDKFITRNDLPVAVDFWAEWCGPCKMFAPVFARLAADEKTRLRCAKLDTEAEPAIAQRYSIRSIPSLLLFDKGTEVDRVAGALDPTNLRTWLQRHLS